MLVPLSLTEREAERFRKFARSQHQTLAVMIRTAVNDKIQEEQDWDLYKKALAEYQVRPEVFSLAEVKREMGLR